MTACIQIRKGNSQHIRWGREVVHIGSGVNYYLFLLLISFRDLVVLYGRPSGHQVESSERIALMTRHHAPSSGRLQ